LDKFSSLISDTFPVHTQHGCGLPGTGACHRVPRSEPGCGGDTLSAPPGGDGLFRGSAFHFWSRVT
jgi:hypothetical protein